MSAKVNRTPLLFIALVASLGFAGLAYYVGTTPEAQRVMEDRRNDERTRPLVTPAPPVTTDARPSTGSVPVYEASIQGESVQLVRSSRSAETPLKALEASLRDAMPVFMLESALIRSVREEAGVVTIDFTPEIAAGMGSSQEALFVQGLQRLAGAYPEFRQVVLTVDGNPIESLGHFEVGGPLEVVRSAESP